MPARVFPQVIACLRGLALDPRPPGARKIVGSDNAWRVHVGDYRAVYEVDDAAFRVIVYG
ncbi:MAG: type II toxin-antitoxin system RelE/ParE family toxin [Bacillota bacterium]